jgi:hypothetical protein
MPDVKDSEQTTAERFSSTAASRADAQQITGSAQRITCLRSYTVNAIDQSPVILSRSWI